MNPQRMREVQQLWGVALNYLESAQALKNDERSYEELLASPDPGTLALSAALDSAAIRLASLDDLLNGGMPAVRARAYSGGNKKEYMHVYLRDPVAHAEPVQGVDKDWYTKRQEWLRKQTLAGSWEGVGAARDRLQEDITKLCRSARDLEDWIKNELQTWLMEMGGKSG